MTANNPFSDPNFGAEASGTNNPFSNPEFGKPSGFTRRVADQGIKLAQGVVGVPEAVVGVADLVTGGQAGKLAESAGVRFKEAKDIMGEYLSPEQKAADAEVQKAEGFLPTLGAMVKNPSTIVGAAMESAPSMIAGGAASRGLLAVAPRLGAIAAGAAGEGLTAAGQNAEQVRQEDANGTLTGQQAAILGASGMLTGGISLASGKLANKLGIGDVQTMLANGRLGVVGAEAADTAAKKGFTRKVAEGFANEGVMQELPQSYQEQVAQNLAQGKPWDEGAAKAGAQGMMAGALMGGGANAAAHLAEGSPATSTPVAPEFTPPTPPGLGYNPQAGAHTVFPDGSVILNSESPSGEQAVFDKRMAPQPLASAETGIPVTETAPIKPSEAMGLNPAAGPLSAAAVTAVDTGAHQPAFDSAAAQAAYRAETEALRQKQEAQDAAELEQALRAEEEQAAAKTQAATKAMLDQATAPVDLTADELFPLPSTAKKADQPGSFVAKLKEAKAKGNNPTDSVGGSSTTPAPVEVAQEKPSNQALAPVDTAHVATENVAKTFDVTHAGTEALAAPENSGVVEAFNKTQFAKNADGSTKRVGRDHFESWASSGGVTGDIGSQYDGHGIAKGNPLGALLNILENGINTSRRFDSAPLTPKTSTAGAGSGLGSANGAYKDGPFILLGARGKSILDGIHTVLVSNEVSASIPALQQRFPNVRFVSHSDAQSVLSQDSAQNQSPDQAGQAQSATNSIATTKETTHVTQADQAIQGEAKQQAPERAAGQQVNDHIGRDNRPLSEGGKPFKTKEAAAEAKKLQPMLRVVKSGKGFALAPKTEKQLAAEVKAAKRLSNPQTSPRGEPIPAHAFIASEGGLHRSTKSDMNIGINPRVGNRTLFSGDGKGLTMERATARLIEEGYLPEGSSQNDAAALIKRSLTKPQFTAAGTEAVAQSAIEAQYEDYVAAEQEAAQTDDFDPLGPLEDHDFLEEAGYTQAAPDIQAKFRALISLAEAGEIDAESIQMDVAAQVGSSATDQEYHEAAITALKAAIEGSVRNGSAVSGSQSQEARNTADEAGLTAPSRAEVLAQQERTETATKAEASQRRAQDLADKRARERKDIAKASEAAADTFVLGGDAEQNLSGQKDIFGGSEPAGKSEANDGARKDAATSTKTPSTDELRAKADLMNALADLGSIFNAPFKANITPEQEQKLLPVLTRVLDAAFRLGYAKFKDAAKFALDQIKAALGNETADALTLDHLQGAYIAMAGGKQGADTKRAVIDIEAKSEIESHTAQTDNERNGESNAPSPDRSVERDSQEPGTQSAMGDAVSPEPGRAGAATAQAGGRSNRSAGRGQQDGAGVPFGSAPVAGERGDQRLHSAGEQPELASIVTGAYFREPGGDSGITGVPAESIPASQVDAVADQSAAGLKRTIERTRADKTPVTLGDINNIRATLPQLLPGQQDDVLLAEQRFAKTDGYGMLFTNGTGTGKTFSGLGVIKRFALQGKTNTLIVAPDSKIASDWIDSGKLLGLDVTLLKDTNDAGKGVVITTYANLGENDTLARRQWDLVVADEAHSLMQAADGEPTGYLHNLRAITYHPDGAGQRHAMLNRKLLDQMAELQAESSALELNIASPPADHAKAKDIARRVDALSIKTNEANKLVEADVSAKQGAERTRLVALSATPFAYEKTIDWANGYLFDYNEGQSDESREFRGYNSGGNKDRYMMQHFGYSMRYNKLTRPDANVDGGLMQRQWNANLKRSGALSGRMLDVKPDYDRRFILVESAIGNRIDEALEWISEQRQAEKGQGPYAALSDAINEQFKYLQKRYLLEAIKATEVIPIVKAHLAMGRKVVVFHDYKKGGGFNPFHVRTADSAIGAALDAFNAKFSDLVRAPLGSMPSPIEVFSRELPQTLLINGDEKKSDLLARYKSFQNDDNGPQVMLVQSAKNKGWSGHDTTGKHQRVLINLGQPTAPTLAIQQEGRIYRTGQASDAIMRYMNTGTNWERWTFATTIASRASTAENLGMGEMARALKDSFIQSFEESDTYAPGHEGEGKGGKERDQAANDAITEYDRAKTFYFGQQKKNSRTKAQEGADYFATPEPLGLKMTQWLDARGGEDVLEPSGGHGAIARWLPENTKRTVIEPSLALRSRLSMVMNPTEDRIIAGTFEDHHVGNKYDGIVMNPPFGTAGRTAIDHLAQAATHLRDGGRIVALIPTGPAANKKFDKWFYESSEVPAKPLQTKTGMQKVYAGDTIHFEGSSFIAKSTGKYPQSLASSDYVTDGVTKAHHGGYGVTPGPRTASVNLAEGLQLVANIKLPSITFERAGTAVETRVVVIEKSDRNVMQRDRDLSDITDIKELFDRLEHLDFPTRAKPVEVAPVEAAKAEKPAPAAKPAKAMASAGDQVTMGDKTYPVEIYTTNAGKEKRGVWMDSKSEASKYSASTFTHSSNKGKWFVDEYWFPKDAKVTQADSGVKFSRQETPTRGTPVPRVQAVVDAITSQWANAPEVVVVSDMQDAKVPQKVREADQLQKSQGAEGEPDGFIYKGTVYLVASELPTINDAVRVLFHEALGHSGLRGAFGDALKPILSQVATMRRADVVAKAREYGLLNPDTPHGATVNEQWQTMSEKSRMVAAEEVLAVMAEKHPELGFVKRAVAAIRNWLRTNVPGFKSMLMTDADIIQAFILPARRHIEGKQASSTVKNTSLEAIAQRESNLLDLIACLG